MKAEVAAALIGYPLPEARTHRLWQMPAMFVPLQQLENLAPGTWYVNVLAAYPQWRNKGLGTRLLEFAQTLTADVGRQGLSIIVSDANPGARRLYENSGYTAVADRPMVKDDWQNPGQRWVLMTKPA